MIRWPNQSRRTRSSPNTRLKSGFIDSKSISVSLTSKIRTEGFPLIRCASVRRSTGFECGSPCFGATVLYLHYRSQNHDHFPLGLIGFHDAVRLPDVLEAEH